MRNQMKLTYEQHRADSPERMSFEAIQTLSRGYLGEGETPSGMNRRLCDGFVRHYPNGYKGFSQQELWDRMYQALQNCWFSPASPVASNFNTNNKALPVSCYGIHVPNSIHGIFKAVHEAAMLTKNGGGIGIDLSDLIGESKVTAWAKQFDVTMANVSQTGVRRGFVAQYLDIDHPDLMLFLDAKDLAKGDVKQKLACNIAVKITDSFMERLIDGCKEAWTRIAKVLEMGLKYGSPYIMFSDNALKQDPPWYKDKGLASAHSQLCSEIFLHSDAEHTYSCVLSSMNVRYFDEWSKLKGISLPELGILFLDAVCQEFIEKAQATKHPEGLMKAVRSAIKGRPLGLGIYGIHAWYMKHMMPFDSEAARIENLNIFQYIREEAEKATKQLAIEKGEPEWCKGWGRRNTHLIAIAPTTTSSIIGNGISPGIEPLAGNYFSKFGAKGTFTRKNPYLETILKGYGQNTDRTWASIRDNLGSVQHLDFLSDLEKEVFKTAFEIDQMALVTQASERQPYIDQGQSMNWFIRPDEEAQKIVDLHVAAWRGGLKSRYYIYSESKMVEKAGNDTFVSIGTRSDCPYCQKAKALLNELGVEYIEEFKPEGRVPEIWLNGEMLEDGYNSLYEWYYGAPEAAAEEENCSSCDG